MTEDNQDHVWHSIRHIKHAEELMQEGKEWNAGFQVGRALGRLEEAREDD